MTFGKTLLLAAAATAGFATAPALAVPTTYAVSQTGWFEDGPDGTDLLSVTGTFVGEDKDGDGYITYYGDPAVDPLELFDLNWTLNFVDGSTSTFSYGDVFGFNWEIGDFLTGEDYVQIFNGTYFYQTIMPIFEVPNGDGPPTGGIPLEAMGNGDCFGICATIVNIETETGYATEEAMRVVPAPGALGLGGLGLIGLAALRRRKAA